MFEDNLSVIESLNQRNATLAPFWFSDPITRYQTEELLSGKSALIIDAEDHFTTMLAQQLSATGLSVQIQNCKKSKSLSNTWDFIVLGPGPGDPRDTRDIRIANMHVVVNNLMQEKSNFFAICLSHQIVCLALGLPLVRKETSNQGKQQQINLFGKNELVGFYNTYTAICDDEKEQTLNRKGIEVAKSADTKEVYALRSAQFTTLQFHPESILTPNGISIITSSLLRK